MKNEAMKVKDNGVMKLKNNFTHTINWDKIDSIEDILEILKSLDMKFNIEKCNPRIKRLLTPIIH